MKIAIIYYNFLDTNGTEQKIGGVETYLWNLAKLIQERGDQPLLIQPAVTNFARQIEHLQVIGVKNDFRRLRNNTRRNLYEKALSLVAKDNGLIIFGADHASVRTPYPRAVSVQHGIGWDLPGRFLRGKIGKIPFMPDWFCKRYHAYRSFLYFNNCPNRVCVDYNFLNWYRTKISNMPCGKIWVIPNFVEIPKNYRPDLTRHEQSAVRIIFARRFVEYRGSRLMIEVSKRILKIIDEAEICFAGEGPDEKLISHEFANEPKIFITKYLPDESLFFHGKFHIALIPSLASEGTSLSLAEAMAAGCAVVATNVGGMTNMVIDGYNGLLVDPDVDKLVNAVVELAINRVSRRSLAQRAAETACEAFSLKRWKLSWSNVLDEVQKVPFPKRLKWFSHD